MHYYIHVHVHVPTTLDAILCTDTSTCMAHAGVQFQGDHIPHNFSAEFQRQVQRPLGPKQSASNVGKVSISSPHCITSRNEY